MKRQSPLQLACVMLSAAAIIVAIANCTSADEPNASPENIEFFEKQVRPILATSCWECHGPTKQEYGLRLDSRAALMSGSDEGPVVTPGKPAESNLIEAVQHRGDYHMPPKSKLPEDQIAALTRWVELGLPWPAGKEEVPPPLKGEALLKHSRETMWSLQPVLRPKLPVIRNAAWPQNPIDYFVLAQLEQQGLTPSNEADRRTLIRRATFDLLGLPPTPEEIDTFNADQSPDAYERLIDRLLASPRYGERWGRHWLDVARYADTRGYSFGRERKFPYAYTYRDWVIRALNHDIPYDQFVTQQLAADCIEGNDPQNLAALGFLTVGRKYDNQPDDIDDQIDAVTRGMLGLTVSCARCHDHKYDAIPTKDYYSLYGVFASTKSPDEYPLIAAPRETADFQAFEAELQKRRQKLENFTTEEQNKLQDLARRRVTDYLARAMSGKDDSYLAKFEFLSLSRDELKPKLVARWREYLNRDVKGDHPVWRPLAELRKIPDEQLATRSSELIASWDQLPVNQLNPLVRDAIKAKPPTSAVFLAKAYGDLFTSVYEEWKSAGGTSEAADKLSAERRQILDLLLAENSPTNIPRNDIREYLAREARERQRALEKEVQSHEANSPGAPARAMSLVDTPQAHEPHVFLRGQPGRPGDRVPRQFLALLSPNERQPFKQGSGRFELSQRIVAVDNPLTPRVIVNRLWAHHVGQPLVNTTSDFGIRSEPPTHPQLLDWLASMLIESGWSLKKIHRQIMLSATYRQQSMDREDSRTRDPENRLLWRMNRRRLEFEPLRDSLLAVSGQLDSTMHGRPVDVFQQPFKTRRTVYAFIDRQELPNVLRAFDFASPDQSSPGRPQTTVPQQALFLMNSPFVMEQATRLVAREEISKHQTPQERIFALYRQVFGREPNEFEVQAGSAFIASALSQKQSGDKLGAWEQYAQLLLMTNEWMFVD